MFYSLTNFIKDMHALFFFAIYRHVIKAWRFWPCSSNDDHDSWPNRQKKEKSFEAKDAEKPKQQYKLPFKETFSLEVLVYLFYLKSCYGNVELTGIIYACTALSSKDFVESHFKCIFFFFFSFFFSRTIWSFLFSPVSVSHLLFHRLHF